MTSPRIGAAVLTLVSAAALGSCASGQTPEPRGTVAAPDGAVQPTLTATSPNPVSAVAVPEHLRIRAIGVSTAVVQLGLNRNRTVEVPRDPDKAGWYDQGPTPGQPGSAVILGHVDSQRGPAVFYLLRTLRPGNRVAVRLSDGTVADFAVERVVTYSNEEFPARRVYAGSPRRRTLALVTCGGVYDPSAGGYQSNVVVYTRAVQPSRPR